MRTVWSALHPDKSWRKIRVWMDCLPRDQKEHARSLSIGNRRLRGSPHLQHRSSGTNCAVGMTWQNSNLISGSGAWALTPNDQCRVRLCRDASSLSRGGGRMRSEAVPPKPARGPSYCLATPDMLWAERAACCVMAEWPVCPEWAEVLIPLFYQNCCSAISPLIESCWQSASN